MSRAIQPSFSSAVFDDLPDPDWCDVVVLSLPAGAPADPRLWAEEIFAVGRAPWPVRALVALRQALVRLIGVPRGARHAFDVVAVRGQEALLGTDERHLDFRCAVGVDPEARLLRVTTAVRLHGRRGRVYFAHVSVLHDPVTRAMARKARRRLTAT